MTLRSAALAALFMAFGCGGDSGGTDLKVGTTSESSSASTTSSKGATVTGKLAPSLGPPATLIILEPQSGAELPVKAEPAIMDQAGYEFLPAFLIAQADQVVQFRNSEDVLHNVRVADAESQEPVFNVATIAFGKYEHKFKAGYYNVSCDIHSNMRASILVTASPYTATTAADGSFSIAGVQPGQYNLTVYAGAAPVVRPIDVKTSSADLGVVK
jgi:plastocyanin